MRRWRASHRFAAVAAVLAAAVGSGTLAGADVSTRRLPPAHDVRAMARIFDLSLAPLGLHLVRAALESADGSHIDPHGNHLAIYVQPTGVYTAKQYRQNFSRVAAAFLPRVFDRWAGVATFDVCQEPLPSLDPRPEPPPVTQLAVSRELAKRFNWNQMSIPKAKAAARRIGSNTFYVFVNDGLLQSTAKLG